LRELSGGFFLAELFAAESDQLTDLAGRDKYLGQVWFAFRDLVAFSDELGLVIVDESNSHDGLVAFDHASLVAALDDQRFGNDIAGRKVTRSGRQAAAELVVNAVNGIGVSLSCAMN
jgi:hypothetical protein